MAASALVLRGVPVEDSSDNQYQASEGQDERNHSLGIQEDLRGTRCEQIALANITFESAWPGVWLNQSVAYCNRTEPHH